MKKFVVLICLCFVSCFNAKASLSPWHVEDSIIVGTQPLAIFSLNPDQQDPLDAYIVYCGGRDLNFNGVQDPGDEAPSLWLAGIIHFLGEEVHAESQKLADLNIGFSDYPFRPAISGNEMYISSNGKITKVTIDDSFGSYSVRTDSICLSEAVAVSKLQDLLFLSEKNDFTSPGWVRVFRLGVGFIDSIPAGVNVQQVLQIENKLYILSEGVFGASESTILVVDCAEDDFNVVDTIHLGVSGSNHMAIGDNALIVTNNLTNDVAVVDLTNNSIARRISLPADASPRESAILVSSCLVSTFSGKVYQLNYESGEILDSADVHGKAEGMCADLETFWVASPFTLNTYDYDSVVNVFIYFLDAEDNPEVKIDSRPNPVTDLVTITIPANQSLAESRIVLSNPMGERIMDRDLNNEEISNGAIVLNTQALHMPNGVYFAEIQSGNSVYRCKFVVSR